MAQFRKVLFWLHLSAGVFAGIVVLIMSVTGVALTYEKQMLAWADLRNYRLEPGPGASPLPIGALLEKARGARGELPSTVTVRPGPADPVALGYGRESTVYLNPYSGEILGTGSSGLRAFFRFMTDWHRWLGASAENRNIGKAITGACNLAFLFIVVSGFYLWWPRSWRWPNVRSIVLFRGGLRGKARDFNWHNVIGFWSAAPLFLVVLSATIISYPWASDLVYRVAGEDPPARRAPGAGPGAPGRPAGPGSDQSRPQRGGAERQRERAGGGETRRGGPRAERLPASEIALDDFEALFTQARQHVAGWRTITLRMPQSADEPLSFAIDQGSGGQPHLRSTLTLERRTAAVLQWETFSDGTPGRRLRSWLRFIHTGEAGGLPGQTIAGLVSGGAAFLVYTGLALTLRRFLGWIARKRRRVGEPVLAGD
jgi:uncharacterized iron-regulated membrane protein